MFQRFTLLLYLMFVVPLTATPTKLFWTPVTTDVLAPNVLHVDVDNYFTLNRRDTYRPHREFPLDIGLLYGLLDYYGLRAEVGADYLAATLDPWFFNAKIGAGEGFLGENTPSVAIGINRVGTRHTEDYRGPYETIVHYRTDVNMVYAAAGQTIFDNFRVFFGGYNINKHFGDRRGYMFGFDWRWNPEIYFNCTRYHKWRLCGDWATGRNIIGGKGIALSYYFTPWIYVESGPIWFNSRKWNGRWKWSIQLNVDIPGIIPCF